MEPVRGGSLLLAVITAGMMAGVFALYAHTVMPGLGRAGDRTFVGGFQALDRAILNPVFLFTYLAPLGFTVLAGVLSLDGPSRPLLPWLAAAFAAYLAVVVITGRVHLPRNDALKAAGDPDRIEDLAGVRARFGERQWRRWNAVRAVLSTVSFACLAWALVLYGGVVS